MIDPIFYRFIQRPFVFMDTGEIVPFDNQRNADMREMTDAEFRKYRLDRLKDAQD